MFHVTSEPLAAASGISSCKAADYLSLASELKSSVHQLQNCTMKPFQLNDRNPLFTVHVYTHTTVGNISPKRKRKQKLKHEREKTALDSLIHSFQNDHERDLREVKSLRLAAPLLLRQEMEFP